MTFVYAVVFILIIMAMTYVNSPKARRVSSKGPEKVSPKYQYERKRQIMSSAEISFFKRLEKVAEGRYYIFPQIHLDSILDHEIKGQSWKPALSVIQRKSVDYVLCDKQTMQPVYAVELDDRSHDYESRQKRDTQVEDMFSVAGLPLVRFRNVGKMTDDQISQKFEAAATAS